MKDLNGKIITIFSLFGLFILITTNASGINYYQLHIRFGDGQMMNSTISLKKSQHSIPDLKQSGPYSVVIVTSEGKILETKDFDIQEEITIEKRLPNGTWISNPVNQKETGIVLNFKYDPKMEKAYVKKNDKVLGLIKLKRNINFSLKTCKDRSCGEEKEIFLENESMWIDYHSSVNGIKTRTLITYPNNSTKEIKIPKKIRLNDTGKYKIKATASKIGYKNISTTRKIRVNKNKTNINYLFIVGIISIILAFFLLLIKLKSSKEM